MPVSERCDSCGSEGPTRYSTKHAARFCAACWTRVDTLTITLRRGQWAVVLAAAANYGSRVPREQGDGGECLRVIAEALGVEVPDAR